MDIETGIAIIMNRWIKLRRGEVLHFITDETHLVEAEAVQRWADAYGAVLKMTLLSSDSVQNGAVIEEMAYHMAYADVIIGATDNSFITTDAVKNATAHGVRFLSLPLSCADGSSLLQQEFIGMDPRWAARAAKRLLRYLNASDTVRITTQKGTDLTFSIKGRCAKFFNGTATKKGSIGSASFEVYVAMEETATNGKLWLDASLGYLGKIQEPFWVTFSDGRLSCQADTPDAKRLCSYLESFQDPTMYLNGELGIGLNQISQCRGVSYIEDESTYGTFHIGMGRNLALGGQQQAAGHFDIITYHPTIYAGEKMIMRDGQLAV